MAFTLQNSINFAQPFIDYIPVTAGLGQEPSASIASMIRNTFLQPPQTWAFNRNEITFSSTTTAGTQDYAQSFAANNNDFGFLEEVTLTNDAGQIFKIKDVYNNATLSKSAEQGRPNSVCVLKIAGTGTATQTVTFRFAAVPDAVYTVNATYQKLVPQFGPYFITSVTPSGANGVYTGTFDPYSLPTGDNAVITGFTQHLANNGTFPIVSCTTTTLTVTNAGATNETASAFASDISWAPIPDQYSDIYNNLYLAEILAFSDDQREQLYRQRGIAAFIAKADGLTEMQKNSFLEIWLARGAQRLARIDTTKMSSQGRGI